MQLGTRWAFGAEPPSRLPNAVVNAIRKVEADAHTTLSAELTKVDGVRQVEHFVRRWTLTWLEGQPCVELDPESGSNTVTLINYNPKSGKARTTTADPDEEE